MNIFEVFDKSTGLKVTEYSVDSDTPLELAGYEFDKYDHIKLVPQENGKPVVVGIYDSLIDIGPFFDRFGDLKLTVLSSNDSVVQAIIRDVSVRKWVDIKRPEVIKAINYIASKVSGIDSDAINRILKTPVLQEENIVLRNSGYV